MNEKLFLSDLKAAMPEEYLAALSLPVQARGRALSLLALEGELRAIRHKVREELLARMRFAWWREAIGEVYEGRARAHPLLQGWDLAVPQAAAETWIDAHEEAYPALPEGLEAGVARALPEAAQARWARAMALARRYRGKRVRLVMRLLISPSGRGPG